MPKAPTTPIRRRLADLVSVGPAMLHDFDLLGIRSVEQLAHTNPQNLYDRLCGLTGHRQDPCVLDSFACAVAQAKNPHLSPSQKKWWYWSRLRKSSSQRAPK